MTIHLWLTASVLKCAAAVKLSEDVRIIVEQGQAQLGYGWAEVQATPIKAVIGSFYPRWWRDLERVMPPSEGSPPLEESGVDRPTQPSRWPGLGFELAPAGDTTH